MPTENIVLAPIEEGTLQPLSHLLTEDDEWREFAGSSDSPFAWLTKRCTAQSLGWSYTQGVFLEGGTLVGFITGDWVEPSWVTADTAGEDNNSVLECGTYLIKSYRRMGLNAQVKRKTLEWASGLGAEVVVYVVPEANTAALMSLRREFPAYEYGLPKSGVHDEGSKDSQGHRGASHKRFSAWLKYREWKQGGKLVLFAIPCPLKNR